MAEPDREAYEAAERLVREAHLRAEQAAQAAAGAIPSNGWGSAGGVPTPDFNALLALLDAAKGVIPPELLRQLADALRELLVAIRAVLDYSIERLDNTSRTPPAVEDIPIE
jgi:hypothetical protein